MVNDDHSRHRVHNPLRPLSSLFALAAIGIMGCADATQVNAPQDVAFKSSPFQENHVTGYRNLTIRTFSFEDRVGFGTQPHQAIGDSLEANDPNRKRTRISGMRCVAETDEFRVAITTPGTMRVPTYKTRPSVLYLTRTGNGYKGTRVITPLLDDVAFISSNPAIIVLSAIMVTAAVANNVWVYNSGVNGGFMSIRMDKTDP